MDNETRPEDQTAGSLAEETHKNVNRIIEIENAQKRDVTTGEWISDVIARFCGSMTFVWVHVVWFTAWIVINTVFYEFDPFPFTFLTLVVSLEAIFLSTFILISQNREGQLTSRRNHLDLQINMLAEQENTKMLTILAQIAEKVGVEMDDDHAVKVYGEDIEPDKLVEQIVNATESEKAAEEDKECQPLDLS
jgi:uncharacterized membrane protein